MNKVGLQVIYMWKIMLCSLIFCGIGKIKKTHYKKKQKLSWNFVLQVILDIPGMELVCREAKCILLFSTAESTETDISLAIS